MSLQLPAPISRLGRIEKIFLILVIADAVVWMASRLLQQRLPGASLLPFAVFFAAIALLIKLARAGSRKLLWRVRNRMILVFLFIGFVPLLLVTALAGLATYILAGQVAVYIASTELDRRAERLRDTAAALAWSLEATAPARRPELAQRYLSRAAQAWPELQAWIHDSTGTTVFPAGSSVEPPRSEARGIVRRGDGFYLVARPSGSSSVVGGEVADNANVPPPEPDAPGNVRRKDPLEVVLLQPLDPANLAALAPGLGSIEFLPWRRVLVRQASGSAAQVNLLPERRVRPAALEGGEPLPAPANRFDYEVLWGTSLFEVGRWSDRDRPTLVNLLVRTRPSAVYRVLFGRRVEVASTVTVFSIIIGTLFLMVELASVATGVSITRTITNSVHQLYEGTRRVNRGDFSHRIPADGRDQLGELSRSFNNMTESIERLIEESKERQRLASELEIAREVQQQLFPKAPPLMRQLEILGVCNAARTVSGDYFDFIKISDDHLALALGDVAGKGISGALLMASMQSMLRTQLAVAAYFGAIFRRDPAMLAALSGELSGSASGDQGWRLPTDKVVSQLNRQLYENTPPEKYATFFLGAYDDCRGLLTYTNAGHLPPVLIRKGQPSRLDINGMVIGLFPWAQYERSEIELDPGDLFVAFTDGVTEPENEFAEEFGDERLIDLLVRNSHLPLREIIEEVTAAVGEWTGRPELQDDMTMVVARRL